MLPRCERHVRLVSVWFILFALSRCLFNLFVAASVSVSVVHACEGFLFMVFSVRV